LHRLNGSFTQDQNSSTAHIFGYADVRYYGVCQPGAASINAQPNVKFPDTALVPDEEID